MKRFLYAVSIFALVAPGTAAAQQPDKNHNGGQHASRPNNRGGGGQHTSRPNNGGGGQHAGRPQNAGGAPSGPARNRPDMASGQRTQTATPSPRSTTFSARQGRAGTRVSAQQQNVRTYSSRQAGARTSNIRRVHASAFRYPRGYSYHRWSAGLILPSIFLSNYYYYDNWATVGAYPPPPGFVWVRYGPDLLLVSRRSGRIRDVIYGVFY